MVHVAKSEWMRRWRLPLRLGIGAPPWSLALSAISIHDDLGMDEPQDLEVVATPMGVKREMLDVVTSMRMSGSYPICERARHAVRFAVTDGAGHQRRAYEMAKNIWQAKGSAPPQPGERMALILRRRGLGRTIGVLLASPSVIEYRLVPVARLVSEQCPPHRAGIVAGNAHRASNVER